MKWKRLLLVGVFLLANYCLVFAQAQLPESSTKILRNGDVLRLYRTGMKPGEIIARILTSSCNFDTFPPVLRELRMKGLPDTVIMAMRTVPYGPPSMSLPAMPVRETPARTTPVEIPAGTLIEIETASPVSSASANEGDVVTFLVSRRVMVNGVLVIDRGAKARAHVIKSKPAGAWGRGGSLGWVLDDVVAVDGTRVPVKLSDSLAGKDRSKAVVAAAIATGAVIFPYTPPVGLIWALKKGDEAVLDQSMKSNAVVSNNTDVAGLLPRPRKAIYHSVEKLKAAESDKGTSIPAFNDSFRATPIGRH